MLTYLYLANTIICIWQLLSYNEETFSLHKIVHIFILIFFILANYLQYSMGINCTSLPTIFNENSYTHFQLILLLILVLYNLIYLLSRGLYNFNDISEDIEEKVTTNNSKILLLFSFAALSLTILTYLDQPLLLFVRGLEDEIIENEDTGNSLDLIISKFIRPIPWCCYMYSKLSNSGTRKYNYTLFFIVCLTLFPLGLARNAVAMYWLPICIMNIRFIYKKYMFTACLICGVLIIFPFLGNFRAFNGVIEMDWDMDYLTTMNFDASQMFMATMDMDIITYGTQLIGVLLFFVPRAIWPEKPIGSGHYVADIQGAFSNVSMPFWGEGFINFGYIGIILFTIFLALFTSYSDKKYWLSTRLKKTNANQGYYLILVGSLIFILRGDLLSSIAYTTGALLIYFLICKSKKYI